MEAYRAPSPWEAILSNIGHRLVARCLALFREVPPFRRNDMAQAYPRTTLHQALMMALVRFGDAEKMGILAT
jgi:hypothetical protein